MISAVVLTPDAWRGDNLARERELVARSMIWLVSAVVAGVVRDVTLAVPAGLGLSALADQSGCALVQADTEGDRLCQAVASCREPRVMILRAGFQPDPGLADEIEGFSRGAPATTAAVLRGLPATMLQRLLPQRAPIVGVIVPRSARLKGGFDQAVRGVARGAHLLHARATPIL